MSEIRQLSETSPRGLAAHLLKTLPSLLPSLQILKRSTKKGQENTPTDATVWVKTPTGKKQKLIVKIKAATYPSNLIQAVRKLKASAPAPSCPVLATSFISPQARKICREEGVGYIDLAGNCFLQFPDYLVEKVVEKNPFPRRGRPPSLFSPVSTRVIRAFLEEPQRTWKVIELAETMKASLGQASKITQQLIADGYIAKTGRELKLIAPTKLLDDWRDQYKSDTNGRTTTYSFEQYPERLMAHVAKSAEEKELRYALTSFAASSLVAPFVRGAETVEWYVENESAVDQWVQALDLRPVEAGANAVLIIPYDKGVFYRTQNVNELILVSNIQLYLDLTSNPARGREQAEFLRKERIPF
ncbi:MAG: hypothetical protein LHV69_01665 [Elusimicrobia bacterium]|nr:hypothetical protein [Candidatus Obscuribacterium magneticum]